jgi:opacity protein-like surface antigen
MRKWIGSALLLAAVAFIPAELVAQRRPAARPATRAQRPRFAAELNWSSDVDFGIGARGVFGLQSLFPKVPLDGSVSFDYFFPSVPAGISAHYWEINGNVAYRFRVPARSSLAPYGGGGLNIAHASAGPSGGTSVSATKAGLNLLGGTTFKVKGTITPFVEARGELGGGKTFVLTGGVRF